MKAQEKPAAFSGSGQAPRPGDGFLRRLPPAVWAFILTLVFAALLAPYDRFWSFFPLVVFVLISLAAPFFPGWQFFLQTATHGPRARKQASLTFDDGPDEKTTPALLALLDKYGLKAAFFVVGSKAAEHSEIVKNILARGHEIGNHSMNHDPILMLRTSRTLSREIEGCNQVLRQSGITTLAFRPPVGIVNPRLKSVLDRLEMFCAGFSVRGGDWGNRKISGLAERIVKRIRPGDIILLHDCRPAEGREISAWLEEVEAVITGVRRKGIELVKLSDLLGREIMIIPPPEGE